MKEGCRTMRRRMEVQKQWRKTLAKKVGGEGDKYIPSQMGAGKFTQHLQS